MHVSTKVCYAGKISLVRSHCVEAPLVLTSDERLHANIGLWARVAHLLATRPVGALRPATHSPHAHARRRLQRSVPRPRNLSSGTKPQIWLASNLLARVAIDSALPLGAGRAIRATGAGSAQGAAASRAARAGARLAVGARRAGSAQQASTGSCAHFDHARCAGLADAVGVVRNEGEGRRKT